MAVCVFRGFSQEVDAAALVLVQARIPYELESTVAPGHPGGFCFVVCELFVRESDAPTARQLLQLHDRATTSNTSIVRRVQNWLHLT